MEKDCYAWAKELYCLGTSTTCAPGCGMSADGDLILSKPSPGMVAMNPAYF